MIWTIIFIIWYGGAGMAIGLVLVSIEAAKSSRSLHIYEIIAIHIIGLFWGIWLSLLALWLIFIKIMKWQ